jgi:hypothetical protein
MVAPQKQSKVGLIQHFKHEPGIPCAAGEMYEGVEAFMGEFGVVAQQRRGKIYRWVPGEEADTVG